MSNNNDMQLNNDQVNHYQASNSQFTFSLSYKFIQLCMILFIGICIGYLYFIVFTNYAKNCSLAYVSNEEIISLEKERISTMKDDENKKLFYGKTEEAFILIDSIARSYENKNTKIVFVNDKFVRGKNVISISKQIHKALIDNLSEKDQLKKANDLTQQSRKKVEGSNDHQANK